MSFLFLLQSSLFDSTNILPFNPLAAYQLLPLEAAIHIPHN